VQNIAEAVRKPMAAEVRDEKDEKSEVRMSE